VVYLTNQRDLDPDFHAFLDKYHIELFFTEIKATILGCGIVTFSMWPKKTRIVDRLVLINDSVIYYQNRFKRFLSAVKIARQMG
jgi:hypothetical protein